MNSIGTPNQGTYMREKTSIMDTNYNYRPKPQPRGHRRSRHKDRGSRSYESSSDEADYASDDNLRPYEEVKMAHHDKKLNGLGKFKCFKLIVEEKTSKYFSLLIMF